MGIAERKERHREQLREEILEAARELFTAEGYENVSMRKIADKIEYSPTTIYLYFKDKDDLLRQICDQTFGKLIVRIQAAVREAGDPVAALKAGCRAYIEFGVEFPHQYRMVFVNPHHPKQEGEPEFETSMGGKTFGTLVGAIQQCVDAGEFRPVDVMESATSFWAMLHGVTMLLQVEMNKCWIDEDRLIDSSVDLIIDGLRA